MSATITVAQVGGGDPLRFDVSVRQGESETRHRVTLSMADAARLGRGAPAEETIAAAFRFLLDREPKESILAAFDVSVIARYFPQFETEIGAYLSS